MMARIVDVEQFLSLYPFEEGHWEASVAFVIEDSFLEWNCRVFVWDSHNRKLFIYSQEEWEEISQLP